LEQTKHLEPYFNKYLEAYEFDLDNEAIKELNCIFSKVIITKTVYYTLNKQTNDIAK
jgi:hypothetical protein